MLTAKGEDALPVLNAVVIWSEKHLPAPSDQAHMYVIHATCGQRTGSADTCTECGERLTAENTSWHSLTRTEEPLPLATARNPDATTRHGPTNRVQAAETKEQPHEQPRGPEFLSRYRALKGH